MFFSFTYRNSDVTKSVTRDEIEKIKIATINGYNINNIMTLYKVTIRC